MSRRGVASLGIIVWRAATLRRPLMELWEDRARRDITAKRALTTLTKTSAQLVGFSEHAFERKIGLLFNSCHF